MRAPLRSCLAILALGTACDPARTSPPLAASAPIVASAAPSTSSSATAPARFVELAEAIALVRALPEVKTIGQQTLSMGTASRPIDLVIQAVKDADATCRDGSCETSWDIAVADREAWEGTHLAQEGLVDLHARVNARDGTVRLHDREETVFMEQSVWRARRLAQHRAIRLIQATPEWTAESRSAARTPGKSLGLMLDHAPEVDCVSAEGACNWTYMALSVCGGCAGHWTRFGVDPATEALFEVDSTPPLPYGTWRAETRRAEAATPDYHDLIGPKERFPDLEPGKGPLGYGAPTRVVTDLAAFHHPTRAVIDAEGLKLVRVELYRKGEYPVFFVEAEGAYPVREKGGAFRAFAARLVEKNNGFACELAIGAKGARVQLDRHAGEGKDGGVYVLIDGSFHPWLGT